MVSLIFGSIATTMLIVAVGSYALFENRASNMKHTRDYAFHVAEAGIDYYLWRLAHDPDDFTDGEGVPGPYLHEYTIEDAEGEPQLIGYFSLDITPPSGGSTLATIQSTGWTIWRPDSKRSIQITISFPSLTDYAILENASMVIDAGTNVLGKIHSNGGIEFNGTAQSNVYSARLEYEVASTTHPGIWTSGAGGPEEFWHFPVAPKDFNSITGDLNTIRQEASADGIHLLASEFDGWQLIFNGDGTFDIYDVTSRECHPGFQYIDNDFLEGVLHCYDINASSLAQDDVPIPANGLIFVEDDVWVEGTVDGRVTIATGRFPVSRENYQEIYLSDSIEYVDTESGDHVLGLIAQGDVIIPSDVPDEMTVHAAIISQYGRVYTPFYTTIDAKTSISFTGSIISFDNYNFSYVYVDPPNPDKDVGFLDVNFAYDDFLRHNPPPGFPTENTYVIVNWEELN